MCLTMGVKKRGALIKNGTNDLLQIEKKVYNNNCNIQNKSKQCQENHRHRCFPRSHCSVGFLNV